MTDTAVASPYAFAASAISPATWRLGLVRTLAWAALMGGWLALGPLGARWLPLWAGGASLLALWVATLAMLHLATGARPLGPRAVATWLGASVVLALGAAAVLDAWGAVAAAVLSLAWGSALVALSRAVRLLRRAVAHPASPVLPAALGGLLLVVMVACLSPGGLALAAAGAAVCVIAGLQRPFAPARGAVPRPAGKGPVREVGQRACRTGLFDCALPVLPAQVWRQPGLWPSLAARWSMLPMMATLAPMGAWCAASGIASQAESFGLHLGAMLLPPLSLSLSLWLSASLQPTPVPKPTPTLIPMRMPMRTPMSTPTPTRAASFPRSQAWLVVPLGLSVLAQVLVPGLKGLMLASLCQSVAWGLAWWLQLSAGEPARPAAQMPARAGWSRAALALLPAAGLLLLGVGVAQSGPAALAGVQLVLGLGALAGAAAAWVAARWPHARPASVPVVAAGPALGAASGVACAGPAAPRSSASLAASAG